MNVTGRTIMLLGALALIVAACGGSSDQAAELPINDAAGDGGVAIAGACLEGEPDCEDTVPLGPDEEPIDLDPVTGEPIGTGSLSVGDVLSTTIDGGFTIQGFYLEDASGAWLCDALAESFPPQCGGDRISFDNAAGVDLGVLQSEQGTTWSEGFVTVVGEVVDGVFVATPISS